MQTITELATLLRHAWREAGLPSGAPAPPAQLQAAEQRLGVALPAELHELYGVVDGAAAADGAIYEQQRVRLWPLHELRVEDAGAGAVVVLADFLISSREYALHLGTSAIVAVGEPDRAGRPIAPDLRVFLAMLLEDHRDLFA